jgi:hypothetical protein
VVRTVNDDIFGDIPDAIPAAPVVPNHRASRDSLDPSLADPFAKTEPTRGGNLFRRAAKQDGKPAQPRAKRQSAPPPPVVKGEFVQPLEDIYSTLAMALLPLKPTVAMAIVSPVREQTEEEKKADIQPPTVAHNCAVAWDEVAQKNESVRRVLKSMTTIGVWGGLVMAHAPILAAVMAETPTGASFAPLFNPAAAAEQIAKQAAEDDTR